jgi:hypothetical protein
MDFLEAKHAAAREIALAFGVPPMLLGIHGDNTYSNYQEANRVFWRQTVLPLAGRIGCALTHWLAPVFGEGLLLSADIDKIEALSADRTALWERVSKAPFLSVNEKRLAAGYGSIDGGDMFLRQYGAILVKDHGDHKAKAVQVANEFGVTPPTGSGIGAKATYAKLKMLSDASFDKSFAKAMVNEIQARGKQKRRRRPPGQRDAARPAKSVCRQHNLSKSRLHTSNLCVEVGSTNHSSRSG